jgi:hypothetical protein
MTINKRVLALMALLTITMSCSQQAHVKLVQDNNSVQAHVQLITSTSSIFSGYLQDLDLLAGVDSTETTVPLFFDTVFSDLRTQSQNFMQISHYDANNKSYKVQTHFTYNLPPTNQQALWTQVMHLSKDAHGRSTLLVHISRSLFEQMVGFYSALPAVNASTSQISYQQELSRVIGFTHADQEQAFRQIGLANLKLIIEAPSAIEAVKGGRIIGNKGTQAEFTLNILDFIFSDEAEVSLTW